MFKNNSESDMKKSIDEKGEAITAVVQDIADRVVNFKGKMGDQMETAVKQARKASHTIDDYVKENPWQCAGLALSVGFMAGWLLKRKD